MTRAEEGRKALETFIRSIDGVRDTVSISRLRPGVDWMIGIHLTEDGDKAKVFYALRDYIPEIMQEDPEYYSFHEITINSEHKFGDIVLISSLKLD